METETKPKRRTAKIAEYDVLAKELEIARADVEYWRHEAEKRVSVPVILEALSTAVNDIKAELVKHRRTGFFRSIFG